MGNKKELILAAIITFMALVAVVLFAWLQAAL